MLFTVEWTPTTKNFNTFSPKICEKYAPAEAFNGLSEKMGIVLDLQYIEKKIERSSEGWIYPNPLRDQAVWELPDVPEGTVILEAFAGSGQRLWQRALQWAPGQEQLFLEAADFPRAGVYWLRLRAGEVTYEQKLLVTH